MKTKKSFTKKFVDTATLIAAVSIGMGMLISILTTAFYFSPSWSEFSCGCGSPDLGAYEMLIGWYVEASWLFFLALFFMFVSWVVTKVWGDKR